MKSLPQQVSESVRRRNPRLYGMASMAGYINEPCLGGGLRKVEDSPPPKRIRQDQKPLLNKLEQEALDYLQRVEPSDYIPQSIRFRLANGLWYKPDVVCFHQQACWEIKGPHSFRGGFENLKMAASKYPWFTWKLWWKEDGRWQEQIVLP